MGQSEISAYRPNKEVAFESLDFQGLRQAPLDRIRMKPFSGVKDSRKWFFGELAILCRMLYKIILFQSSADKAITQD